MTLLPFTLAALSLFILSATAPRGCDAKVLGRDRNIPRSRPPPNERGHEVRDNTPDAEEETEPDYITDGTCVRVKLHDDSQPHKTGAPSYSRYRYGYGYNKQHGYGYGYHHSPAETSEVATCAAFLELHEQVQNLTLSFNSSNVVLFAELVKLDERITILENELDELQGEGKNLIRVFLTLRGSERRVCAFNSIIEAAELCRRFRNRLNNPYFIHLPCNDPAVASVGDECYVAPNFWYLEPLCFTGVNEPGFFRCFKEPEPDQTCNQVGYLSCDGYATGRLAETAMRTENMNMVVPSDG